MAPMSCKFSKPLVEYFFIVYLRFKLIPMLPIPRYENECLFYKRIRPELGDSFNAPHTYAIWNQRAQCHNIIILDDLSVDGGKFPNAKESLTLQHMKCTYSMPTSDEGNLLFLSFLDTMLGPALCQGLLRSLATLHARFWESPRFIKGGDLDWVPTPKKGGIQFVFDALGEGLIGRCS